jgi:Fuc2NAc and GlcNAc transferase
LILGATFFIDATVTLVRRVLRRQRVYEAHRSHAYQWLARRWHSHERVTILVLLVNLLWLLPCAVLTMWRPAWASWIVIAALLPVAMGAVAAGAGRAETSSR